MDVIGTALGLNWRRQRIKRQQFRESHKHHQIIEPADWETQRIDEISSNHPSNTDNQNVNSDELKGKPTAHALSWESGSKSTENSHLLIKMDAKLKNMEVMLKSLGTSMKTSDTISDIPVSLRLEWTMLTIVLDRLFVLMFLALNIVALVLFYPRKVY